MGITLAQALSQGATPIPAAQSSAAAAFQSFAKTGSPVGGGNNVSPATPALKQFIATGAAPGAEAPKQGVVANLPAATADAVKPTVGTYKGAVTSSADSLANAMNGTESPAAAASDTFKNFTQPTIDAYNKILAPVSKLNPTQYLNPVVDFLSGKPAGTTDKNQAAGQDQATQLAQVWAAKHPDAAKELAGLKNAGELGMLAGGAEEVPKAVDAAQTAVADGLRAKQFAAEDANAGTSALHLPGQNNIYAKITPEQQAFLKDEVANIPSDAADKPHLTPLEKLQSPELAKANADANVPVPQRVTLDELAKQSPNVKAALDKFAQSTNSPTETGSADHVLSSRIADATPDYSKKMVSDFIQNAKGEIVPRVNEGEGLTGNRTVNSSKSEVANGQELANIKNYPDNGTALQKSQAVHAEISSEANSLKTALSEEDKATPLDTQAAKDQVTKNVFDNMNGDAKNAVVLRGKVGDLAKSGISPSDAEALAGKSPSSIVGRYGQNVAEALSEYDGSRTGLLKLRQTLDGVYEDARGKSAFGTDHQNALDEMHTAIRDYLNKELHDSTTNTDVQKSLTKQSRLFRAKDVLDQKAAAEATSKTSRYLQNHPMVRKGVNMVQRDIIKIPLQAAGLAGAGLALKKALSK